jgi:hypothetical protein
MPHSIMDTGEREIWKKYNILFLINSTCAQVRRDCVVTQKTFSDWLNYSGRVAAEVTWLGAKVLSTSIPSAHTKRGGEMCIAAATDNLH